MKSLLKLLQRTDIVVGDTWQRHRGRPNDYTIRITHVGKVNISYEVDKKSLSGVINKKDFYDHFRKR